METIKTIRTIPGNFERTGKNTISNRIILPKILLHLVSDSNLDCLDNLRYIDHNRLGTFRRSRTD